MIAERLGLPVGECLRRVSHREYLGWCEHFRLEWDRPDRGDHYLMKLGQILLVANGKKNATMSDVRIDFAAAKPRKKEVTEADIKRVTETAKAVWLSRMIPPKKQRPLPPQEIRRGQRART